MSKKMLAVCAAICIQAFANSAYAGGNTKNNTHNNVHNNIHNNVHNNGNGSGSVFEGGDQSQTQHQNATANSRSNSAANSASNSTSSSNTNVANTAQTGDSSSTSSATGGNSSASVTGGNSTSSSNSATNVTTGDVKTGDSTSTSSSTANGGAGGQGGAGGNSSLSNSGNGGGATVNETENETTNITDNSKSLVFFPVQAPALPTTIAVGGVRLEKIGECGRRVKVRPFERQAHVPQIFGLWQKSVSVQTMHGILDGFDTEKPFIVDEVLIPAPFNRKVVTVYGHQVYLTVGQDGFGGGSSGAANFAADKAAGVGLGLNANNSFGVIGVVVLDCVYDPDQALKPAAVPAPPAAPAQPVATTNDDSKLDAPKVKVLADTGRWVKVKEKPQGNPCGAREGEKCVYVHDRVPVVKEITSSKGEKK